MRFVPICDYDAPHQDAGGEREAAGPEVLSTYDSVTPDVVPMLSPIIASIVLRTCDGRRYVDDCSPPDVASLFG